MFISALENTFGHWIFNWLLQTPAAPVEEEQIGFKNEFAKWILNWLTDDLNIPEQTAFYIKLGILILILLIGSFIIVFFIRRLLLTFIERVTARTKTQIDDIMVQNRVFASIAHLIPALFIKSLAHEIFADFKSIDHVIMGGINIYLVILIMRLVNAFLRSSAQYLETLDLFENKPVTSYVQLGKVINYLIGGIIIVSIAINRDPVYLFSAMGAMTAVLLLIFRDTILGFVASIQLAGNDMVRINDWVTMDRYGADGDVIEINLTTIKIRNFDKTITTIPTYSFISDSFKNWRGMTESDGRRIKRSIKIDLSSVKHVDDELLERLSDIKLIKEYLQGKQQEINAHNEALQIDNGSNRINGRSLTNVGVFRAYITNYLHEHPGINTEMTLMVRQLEATEAGLPMEVYCFTKTKEWAIYEGVMADVFDHILAVAPHFGLRIFQNPTGSDFLRFSQ